MQTAQIIASTQSLLTKNLIKIDANKIFLHRQIWKDSTYALNWIKCLHIYCVIKKHIQSADSLYFNDMETGELLGSIVDKKPKLLVAF